MASYDLKAILGGKLRRLTNKTLKALVDCMCTVGASLCSLDKRVSALESVEFPEGGYKPMQEPVASPNASGTAIQFIESMSQDASGRMTATKKTVRSASESQSGVMSREHYAKLNALYSKDELDNLFGSKADSGKVYQKETVSGAYNLNNAISTAFYDVQSSSVSSAPVGGDDRVFVLANENGGLIHQLLVGIKGVFWRLGAKNASQVQMLQWHGPLSDEQVYPLKYVQIANDGYATYDVQLFGNGLDSTAFTTNSMRFRVFRPQNETSVSVYAQIGPSSLDYLHNGFARCWYKVTSTRNSDGYTTTRVKSRYFNNIDYSEATFGQVLVLQESVGTATSSYDTDTIIDGNVIYYSNPDSSSIKRTVLINFRLNITASYRQGAVAHFCFGDVRCKDFFEY